MKPSLMEDKKIVSRCLAGEIEAFEFLVNKYQENILSMSWSIMQNKEEAKDVTQEAFAQAYFNLCHFDKTKSFKNWLYSIAYRKCIDRKRKEKLLSRYIKKTTKEESLSSDGKDKERRIEESEIFGPILAHLNEKERTTIFLKIGDGYSAKEIAQIINCAESTVRVYLFNAKRKLKKMLEEKKDV